MEKFTETYLSNPKKTPGQMTGWKDRTQFHGTLPDTVRGPTSTNTVDWQ